MNICILSKFPPLEGGIAAKTYWLARGYAETGLNVHVVSNSNITPPEYRIDGCYPHIKELPGITLHEAEEQFPWHIPEEPHSLAKLVDKVLEVHKQTKIDVIDTGYLIPYGIAGYLAHLITGIPYIVRHGGSDIAKFLDEGHLASLLEKVLANAAAVITDSFQQKYLSKFSTRIEVQPPYVPNPVYFHPGKKARSAPNLLFIGKINWFWERKGLDKIVEIAQQIPDDWKIKIIGQGKGEERFKELLQERGRGRCQINQFIPPWEVSSALKEAEYVFCLAVDEPIPSFLNTLIEAISCGATVVVGRDFDLTPYQDIISNIYDNILVAPLDDPSEMTKLLLSHWGERQNKSANQISILPMYQSYINHNLRMLHISKGSTLR